MARRGWPPCLGCRRVEGVEIRRGDIWWSDLGPVLGSAPAGRRPVLVISGDGFNASNLRTVVVAALTTNVDRAKRPANVLLEQGTAGLARDSVVMTTQLRTLDKATLVDRCGMLSRSRMAQIDAGLRRVLDLPV
jgi:mRNA interferase MazF